MTFTGGGVLSGTQSASAFTESITGPNSSVKTFTYDPFRDTGPFTGQDRLVLRLTNNAGGTLSAIKFTLSSPPGAIDGGLSYGGSYNAGTFNFDGTSYIYDQQNVSGQGIGFTATFATPIPVGGTYAFYIPVALPTDFSSGTLDLTQTPTVAAAAVPEPASLVLAGLGLAGFGLAGLRRRRAR